MSLFGAIVKTVVNVATLPIAVAHDAVSLFGAIDNNGKPHTLEQLQKLKNEADED